MNKNVIIGILVILVVILGALLVKSNGGLQDAAIIKSNTSKSMTDEEKMKQFNAQAKEYGTYYKWSESDLKVIGKAYFEVTPPPKANERPYACRGPLGNFSFNSFLDHGPSWTWDGGYTHCEATGWGYWS